VNVSNQIKLNYCISYAITHNSINLYKNKKVNKKLINKKKTGWHKG